MPRKHTAGSFTKNFSWNRSYERLHKAVAKGFAPDSQPVTRNNWRHRSGIKDKNRQLIPMNFFLYSYRGLADDFILVDQFVDAAFDPYNEDFARLALFTFHLALSGRWKNSPWLDGDVAGWANEFIREVAWLNGDWMEGAFEESTLMRFIGKRIDAEPVTRRKILTNYRYMLTSAGILTDGKLQQNDLRQRWRIDAVQLFWDRQVFEGGLSANAGRGVLEESLIEHEIFKLLRCKEMECQTIARAAFGEYLPSQGIERLAQINELKAAGLIAA